MKTRPRRQGTHRHGSRKLAEVRRQMERDEVNAGPDTEVVEVLSELVAHTPNFSGQAQRVQVPRGAYAFLTVAAQPGRRGP